MIDLQNPHLLIRICPEFGGGLARFDVFSGGRQRPLMRSLQPPAMTSGKFEPNRLACYPLLPWSNRITDGGFVADGRRFELANNRSDDPYPIHGSGWERNWVVRERTVVSATLVLEEVSAAAYSYQAMLRYTLDGNTLGIDLEVVNLARWPMPFGLGLHPFFFLHGGIRLQAAASQVWLNDGCSPIPDRRVDVPSAWNFHDGRDLPDEELNHCFTGWSGRATIQWPAIDLAMDIDSDTDTYILYTPRGADFFCFEPVDHVIDALHRPGGAVANGMTRLESGQRLRRRFAFHVRSLEVDGLGSR